MPFGSDVIWIHDSRVVAVHEQVDKAGLTVKLSSLPEAPCDALLGKSSYSHEGAACVIVNVLSCTKMCAVRDELELFAPTV
jgi:hypothetical protein